MIEMFGNFSLSLAVLVAALAGLTAVAAGKFESATYLRLARWLLAGFAALLTVSSAALLYAMMIDDFRFEYVAHYSERALPTGYKIAAFWAGQEGSLLLWAWMLAVMALLFVIQRRADEGTEAAATIVTLATVCGFFAALMLFAANPFELIAQVPRDGRGLNPMLQDPGMIAHPPALFLGYAGFTIPFAMMVGALVAGRRDNRWIDGIRRWTVASWLFLGIGILLGAQWAYVELGWGGYWAWDPVENASLLPWLTGTALLHSIMPQQHRGMFKKWNVFLIAASFILCIFGTYLTRSGVIQSVHSFGESLIGTFFLAFLLLCVLVSAGLIAWRRNCLRSEHELEGLFGREGAFLATNVLLVGMTAVTLIGTIFPILSSWTIGREVTVGPAFYNKVVAPLGLLLAAVMGAGPLLTYGKDAAKRLARGLILPGIVGVALVAVLAWRGVTNAWALASAWITALVVVAIAAELLKGWALRCRTANENPVTGLARLLDGNHRRYGGQIVHLGMIMIIVGIAGSSLYGIKETKQLHAGESMQAGGFEATFVKLEEVREANFTAVQATVELKDESGKVSTVRPQRRFYDKAEDANSEVSIHSTMRQDVYLTLAGWEDGGAIVAIQVLVNPLVSWIWTGGLVMTLGGIICLLPRILPQPAAEVKSNEEQPAAALAPRRPANVAAAT